ESLRERYPFAVECVFDPDFIWSNDELPRFNRNHVFDTMEGIRLVISKQQMEDGVFICVSPEVDPRLRPLLAASRVALAAFLQRAIRLFRQISLQPGRLELIGLTAGKGIPRWRLRL